MVSSEVRYARTFLTLTTALATLFAVSIALAVWLRQAFAISTNLTISIALGVMLLGIVVGARYGTKLFARHILSSHEYPPARLAPMLFPLLCLIWFVARAVASVSNVANGTAVPITYAQILIYALLIAAQVYAVVSYRKRLRYGPPEPDARTAERMQRIAEGLNLPPGPERDAIMGPALKVGRRRLLLLLAVVVLPMILVPFLGPLVVFATTAGVVVTFLVLYRLKFA